MCHDIIQLQSHNGKKNEQLPKGLFAKEQSMDFMKIYKKLKKNTFSRSELYNTAKLIDSSFKETQLRFYIGKLKNENLIISLGRDLYAKNVNIKESFIPETSEISKKIISVMKEEYPLVSFRILDLSCMNEFVNHLMAHNYIILEVEKEGMEFIYNQLQELFPTKVLLNPSKKEIELYSGPDDIIIMPLTTESPEGNKEAYNTSLEKLIVDMFANKVIQMFISKGDYPRAIEDMFEKYNINEAKLFRYARRRNKANEIYDFINEKTNVKLITEEKR